MKNVLKILLSVTLFGFINITMAGGKKNSYAHSNTSTERISLFTGLQSDAAKTVIQFHHAINKGDAKTARMLLDGAVMVFEGGGVERSADQYASHHMKSDINFLSQLKITIQERQVKTIGDMAVSISRSHMTGEYKGKMRDINSMETMVLKKVNGEWKIIHIHWSN